MICKKHNLYKKVNIKDKLIYKVIEKEMEFVNGVMALIIMEIGKMENGMGLVYFFKKRELKIKDNGKMIRSMEEVK